MPPSPAWALLEIVITTTTGGINDHKYGIMTTHRFSEYAIYSKRPLTACVTLWSHVRVCHKRDPSFFQRTVDRCAQFEARVNCTDGSCKKTGKYYAIFNRNGNMDMDLNLHNACGTLMNCTSSQTTLKLVVESFQQRGMLFYRIWWLYRYTLVEKYKQLVLAMDACCPCPVTKQFTTLQTLFVMKLHIGGIMELYFTIAITHRLQRHYDMKRP